MDSYAITMTDPATSHRHTILFQIYSGSDFQDTTLLGEFCKQKYLVTLYTVKFTGEVMTRLRPHEVVIVFTFLTVARTMSPLQAAGSLLSLPLMP